MASEIEKLREWEDGDSVYRTSCECMSDSDQLTFMVNVDKDDGVVWLELFADVNHDAYIWKSPAWSRGIRTLWYRVKSCAKLLWTGRLSHEAGFIFRGEAHMDEFCATIQEAKERAKKVAQEKGYVQKQKTE